MSERPTVIMAEAEAMAEIRIEGDSISPIGLVHLIPKALTEKEIAKDFADRIRAKLQELCELQTEAARAGFPTAFSQGQDGFGRVIITSFVIAKKMDV